jgi:hypothetical protein
MNSSTTNPEPPPQMPPLPRRLDSRRKAYADAIPNRVCDEYFFVEDRLLLVMTSALHSVLVRRLHTARNCPGSSALEGQDQSILPVTLRRNCLLIDVLSRGGSTAPPLRRIEADPDQTGYNDERL